MVVSLVEESGSRALGLPWLQLMGSVAVAPGP